MSEEHKMIQQAKDNEVLTAFNKIPYNLINSELEGKTSDILNELTEIIKYYLIYHKGAKFNIEGTNGDYVGSDLRYKMAASLIDKEARFLFAESPTITIEHKSSLGKATDEMNDALTILKDLVETVLEKNNFEDILLKAAKDCFIGKRVAGLVNFNEDDGISVTFLQSTQFIYETKPGNNNVLTKFVAFIVVKESIEQLNKRIFKKKFTLEDNEVYLEETMYDGAGNLIEEITEKQTIKLNKIPAVVFLNDGLLGDIDGESEINILSDYESWYSKLNAGDIDAGRKSMNPTRYVVDMDSKSTQNLSTAAGAFWDLGSDQNLDHPSPQVGLLEPGMNYSTALKSTLDRIKTTAYEQIDMPNITLESLQGAVTSGKSLKALYWPLIVRCKEKMKMWGPQLQNLIDILIQGSLIYPECAKSYLEDNLIPVSYRIVIEQNIPIQDDENEEKQMDIAEVGQELMSKKSYMQKWRGLTDDEVEEELKQMAIERQILEDSSFLGTTDIFTEGSQMAQDELEVNDNINNNDDEESVLNDVLDELESLLQELEV